MLTVLSRLEAAIYDFISEISACNDYLDTFRSHREEFFRKAKLCDIFTSRKDEDWIAID
jgi:hypothetical protein